MRSSSLALLSALAIAIAACSDSIVAPTLIDANAGPGVLYGLRDVDGAPLPLFLGRFSDDPNDTIPPNTAELWLDAAELLLQDDSTAVLMVRSEIRSDTSSVSYDYKETGTFSVTGDVIAYCVFNVVVYPSCIGGTYTRRDIVLSSIRTDPGPAVYVVHLVRVGRVEPP